MKSATVGGIGAAGRDCFGVVRIMNSRRETRLLQGVLTVRVLLSLPHLSNLFEACDIL
jgi:hypothetical protein